MTVLVKSRSKSLRDVKLPKDANTVAAVLKTVSSQNNGINTNRIRLTVLKEDKHVAVTSDHFFEEGVQDQLFAKDIGPQVSWRFVFFVEYLGPILIHSFVYWLSTKPELAKYHCKSRGYNPFVNRIAYTLVMIHYLKRELESLFLHKFSQSTMPFFNLFKNSFHYWILNGIISLGYFGYGFLLKDIDVFRIYSALKIDNFMLLLAGFLVCELWNFYVHYKLRAWGDSQKAKGITQRVPLQDGIFKVFVAPNYTFEVLAWTLFTLIFKLNIFAVFFLLVSATQMYLWAAKKNRRYGTKRAFLIPYIL
ncbi:trans-2-enoyl-CoA reductase (NADPH) TSC13 [Lachancea thermotolerans CBS 6340]|uniref:KLTH0E15950p n=1 Tax=Lachancea thermotolerans (strain ATCC 56472 / CBS 6340 / NRRL Y-8284) TaxID=559295 RepID=C5DIX6_LACTC|nr:KLTH0E15950p [Lachancea thermotolerans CBS 6340]CAR23737.1 KLTH0E15950p [Lachancea thermotolerans CBS 6340]